MTTKPFAFLSTLVVAGTILAGCGLNPAGNVGSSINTASQALVADGSGHMRTFGYKFTGNHVRLPGFNFGTSGRALPASVDLRTGGKVSPVYDQGQLGSCTAFAMGKGLRETLTNIAGKPASTLSAMYVYYKERELRGSINEDSGAMMVDGMNVLQNSGACLDKTMPYDVANFTDAPSAAAEKEAANFKIDSYTLLNNLDELKASLADGKPAVFGFTVYRSFMSSVVASTGKMPMPKPNEQVMGGHAVFIVGYDDAKKVLIIKNSWGGGWGDKGYFYMPYAYVTSDKVDEIYVGNTDHK